MNKKDKKKQQSIGRRVKSKIENMAIGIAIVGVVYASFLRRSFHHDKQSK